MKKIILLLFSCSILLSCSNDDNPSTSDVSGTWKLTSAKYQGEEQATDCQLLYGKFVLSSTSAATEYYGRENETTCVEENDQLTYLVSGSTLTVTEANATGVPYKAKYTIVDVTDTILKLKLFYTEQESPSGGTDIEEIPESERVTYSYLKQ